MTVEEEARFICEKVKEMEEKEHIKLIEELLQEIEQEEQEKKSRKTVNHVKVVSSDEKLVWCLVDGYKIEYIELFEGNTAPPNDMEFRSRHDAITSVCRLCRH